MSKITNSFIMLELLNSGKKFSLKELSNELGVSERMVRYYKEQLELAGILIESYKGPGGGYFINKHSRFKISFFNKYDIELLDSILLIIKDKGNEKLERDYLNLLDRLKSTYEINKQISEYSEIDVTLGNPDMKIKIINEAIKNKTNIKITYQNIDGRYSKRTISPITFFEFGNLVYLTAFCHLRGAIRHFELNKIIDYSK